MKKDSQYKLEMQAKSERNKQLDINKQLTETAAENTFEISKAVNELFPIVQCPRCNDIKWSVEKFNSQYTSVECNCVSCNKKMWFKSNIGLDAENIERYKTYISIDEKKLSDPFSKYKTLEIRQIRIETSIQDIVSTDAKRHSIPALVKREVWQRDGGKCVECGSNEALEYDHIIPVSKGGANTVRNIQLLCESCNRKKTNKIE
ncbi:MAG: HNH endonuclease [Candidatus Marinimicrobia bacterium]|nr:HNH endonuclease [Candidatus Neomarinimicrobiota bacterium]